MKLPLQTRIVAGFLFAFALLAAMGIVLYRTGSDFQSKRIQVGRWRDGLHGLDAFRATLQEAETGQRGYIITGDEDYLKPYIAAKNAVNTRLGVIQALSSPDPAEQALIAE